MTAQKTPKNARLSPPSAERPAPRLPSTGDNEPSLYLRGIPFPTGRGLALVALGAVFVTVAVARRSYLALGAAAAILAILAASAYVAWDLLRKVSVERDINIRGHVGKPVPFRVRLIVHGRTRGFVVAKDQNFGVHPVLLGTDADQTEAVWLLRLTQRGHWDRFRTMLATSAPAGLFVAKKEIVSPADVVIGPHFLPLTFPLDLGEVGWSGEVKAIPPKPGTGVDFLNVREYRFGDRLRRIHWRAFARHDDIFVREMEHEGRLELAIAVETTSPSLSWVTGDSGRYPSLEEFWRTTPALPSVGLGDAWGEQALVVAASLAVSAMNEGHTVYLISGSQELRRPRSTEEVLEYFAMTRFGPDLPTVPKLAALPRRAVRIFVTSPHSYRRLRELDPSVVVIFTDIPQEIPNPSYVAVVDRRITLVRTRRLGSTDLQMASLDVPAIRHS